MNTVRVRFLANVWSAGGHWRAGEVATLSAGEAQALIDAKAAEVALPQRVRHVTKSST